MCCRVVALVKTHKAFLVIFAVIVAALFTLQVSQIRGYSRLLDFYTWPIHNLHPVYFPFTGRFNLSSEIKYEGEDDLTKILTDRLSEFSSDSENLTKLSCTVAKIADEACFDATCPGTFSSSSRERLRQIFGTRVQIPSQYTQAMDLSARTITRRKYIFVTAASTDHYYEMQGLIRTLHGYVFPRLVNYTFVIFDLGLTPFERYVTEKNCRCTVLDFPFSQLPQFMRHLTCYAWKAVVVASLMGKTEHLIWMDACIRWTAKSSVGSLLARTKQRGYQAINSDGSIAVRTVQSMFDFYGDQQCQYAPFAEMLSGLEMYYNDRFTREAILQPWLSCAFDQRCMCVKDSFWQFDCTSTPPRRYGRCHRYDQSSLGIILSKLYLDHRPIVYLPPGSVQLAKRVHENWFEPRKNEAVAFTVVLCFIGNVLCLWPLVICRRRRRRDSCGYYTVGNRLCRFGVVVLAAEVAVVVYFVWAFV